ncbi:ABC transporter permease [Oculatella sp. LEGE 06141]|uniref:ABC transporter permease n=1 Tax=Oculatella sp. LEGE 06141 TaxID=1828648 RepID=UPI0018803D6F|nr:ABC transporter permease [Oculatella sp. LEGE 06141]MBE9181239.1 ABC transporter permease [Oculatella sp. LEGE 06141]
MKSRSITAWGVYSVWRRHAKVYQRTWLVNCLPPISEPIIYLVAFGYGLTPLIGNVTYGGQTVSYLEFIAPAMISIGVLFQSFFEGAYGTFIRLNFQKTWQALLTAPLTFSEVFLGDWLWAATKGMIAGSLTGLVAVVWGLYPALSLLFSLPIMFLGSLLFGAMGLLTAGSVRQVDQVNVPVFLVIVPMFTLCGTYFPRTTLPPGLKQVADTLPLSALTDLMRWHLALPQYWWLGSLWMITLTGIFAGLAVRRIYPQLMR